MTLKETLLEELEHTPEPILEQVFNFLRFLKANSSSNSTATPTSMTENSVHALSDEERLIRLNKLFGAWKDQPDLAERFTEIDRERHAYQCGMPK
jgi:hypothetical protein